VLAPPGVAAGNLVYPADGRPLPLAVVPVPPFRITLVPVRIQGRSGQVAGPGRTLASWVDTLRRHFPLDQIQVSQGEVYSTAQTLEGTAGCDALLRELEAVRLVDGTNDDRCFYGVVPAVPGARQIAGRSYRKQSPDPFRRTAIGYDAIGGRDGESYPEVLTHEIGHGLGLMHAPCGDRARPERVDPGFPYPDGGIGACGFDVVAGVPKDPRVYKDDMSYCWPKWSSDYDVKKILAFRARERPPASGPVQDGLLIRGLVQFHWDARAYPEAMVRNACTSHILGLARGGRLELDTPARELECLFSDGLRTILRRVAVRR
jgi:hypothetical protein